jgi:tryptophan synthase alpha chain
MESNRITRIFDRLRESGRAALMPYLTMGYPQRDSALHIVPALVEAGADLIELGVPFSDPLADGATIQAAGQIALENGLTLELCLEQASLLRAEDVETPFVLMGYYNPIYQMGLNTFARKALSTGIDGVIVPDLPPEEADALQDELDRVGIALILLIPPSSDPERLEYIAARSRGFLYLVSLTGVTGARHHLPSDLGAFCARARQVTGLPLAVGFGISTPEQAAKVARVADGVIVGSALIKAIAASEDPTAAAYRFLFGLRATMDREQCLALEIKG